VTRFPRISLHATSPGERSYVCAPLPASSASSLPEAITPSSIAEKREERDPRRPCTALHNKINIDARRVSNDTKSPFSTRHHWRTSSRELIRRREPLYLSIASQPNYRFSYARGSRLKRFNVCGEVSVRKKIKALPKPSYDICFARIAKIPRIREIRGANGGFVAVAMNRGEFASQTDDKSEVSPAAREPSRSIALSLLYSRFCSVLFSNLAASPRRSSLVRRLFL